MDKPAVRDGALLVQRLVLGFILIAHGYDHFFRTGITESTRLFVSYGVPQPKLAVLCVGTLEILGGAMLIAGILTTVVAGLCALLMIAAIYFAHLHHGIFAYTGGWELELALLVLFAGIVVFGPGRASVDHVL